jgi:hypothetical protein
MNIRRKPRACIFPRSVAGLRRGALQRSSQRMAGARGAAMGAPRLRRYFPEGCKNRPGQARKLRRANRRRQSKAIKNSML